VTAGQKRSAKPRPAKRRGRPTKTDEERLGVQLSVRADPETERRIVKLSAELRNLVPRSSIARAALRLGLAAIELDPSVLFDEQPLNADQADKLLLMHWRRVGDAEFANGVYSVWLMTGPGIDPLDTSHSADSKTSFKVALDRLALKVAPDLPLPWQHGKSAKPKK
jgi:hypothetical protein